jgi:hypothetical protein
MGRGMDFTRQGLSGTPAQLRPITCSDLQLER